MQVISCFPPAFKCEPFYQYIERWFVAGMQDRLPSREFVVSEEDMLLDYRIVAVSDGGRIKYTESGQALEKLYGEALAGRYLDELYNPWFRKVARENYEQTLQARYPVYDRRTISTITRTIGYQKIILPVGEKAEVRQFITYLLPTDADIETREDWERLVKETPWL